MKVAKRGFSNDSTFLIFLLAPSIFFAVYYMLSGKMLEAILVLPIGLSLLLVIRYISRRHFPRRVDFALTTAIFHMYGLSMGETSPEDLVETIAENREYGFYSSVFQRIRSLAKDFGYGITKATAHMAESVKPPLKDILVRLTHVFSSLEPRGYLEMESSMLIEEYSGYYTRSLETLKTLGGIFTSFQSVTVFLIMTIVIMAIFMIDPSAIIFGYIIAVFAVVMMYILFRASSPREKLVYVGKYPPKLYLAMRWGLIATGASSTLLAILLYFSKGPPFAFMTLGLGVVIPGIFGYMLERHVNQIDRNYPTFLKALGENLASTSDLKAAFSYIILMELGPFKKLVREALARLKLGISHEQTLETLASEAASYQVHISNRIFLDALSRGANPLEIGNALGNRVVRFIEFRKSRDVTAKGFQMIIMILQPLTVALLIVMQVLADFMSRYLVNLPYFGFNAIPIPVIEVGNIIIIFIMAVVNALTIKEVSGGYWGSFLLNLGILLIVSGVTWMAARILIEFALGSMPSLELPI
ncbi:MAG: hypothetical protein QXZ51_02495 [Candidatus Bathyarchaeia archaeon]